MSHLIIKTPKGGLAVYTLTDGDLAIYEGSLRDSLPEHSGILVEVVADLFDDTLSNKDLLALFNIDRVKREEPVLVKFQNRGDANERTFGILPSVAAPFHNLVSLAGMLAAKGEPEETIVVKSTATVEGKSVTLGGLVDGMSMPTPPVKADKAKRGAKNAITIEPATKAYPCREGTRQAALVDALVKGATMADLRTATGGAWKDDTIVSAFYYDLKNKGYGIRTDMTGEERVFHLVIAEGQTLPAHTPRKTKAAS